MQFITNKASTTHPNPSVPVSHLTNNDAKELILTNITNDIIQVSKFASDINDEVYALMAYCDIPDYVALDSMEFVTAIYWIGLLKGVELDAQDIEKIIDNLNYHVLVNGGSADFIDEDLELMEVNQ